MHLLQVFFTILSLTIIPYKTNLVNTKTSNYAKSVVISLQNCYTKSMNLYDFDKTIYNGECSLRLYLFVLSRHPKLWWHTFKAGFYGVLRGLNIINLTTFKQKFLTFMSHIKDPQKEIELFWDKEQKNIFKWYLEQKKPDDVICSASPLYIIEPILKRINPTAKLVCSDIDMITSRIENGEVNCKGEEKVRRLAELGLTSFENGYSDSKSDVPMLKLCKNKFHITKKGKVEPFNPKYFE